MKATDLYTIWSATFEKARYKDLEHCFSIVMEHYANPNRHYHNLKHIENLVAQIQQLSLSAHDHAILIHVALFHDVIYKAGRKDNEQKSAEFARYWLSKLNFGTTESQLICDIIRATKTHRSSDFLTQLFLDMDLSILGENEGNYQEYTHQIRKEHIQIPNYLYKIGRKRFLKMMLSREVIFTTPKYYEAFENRARKNLRNELNSLKT
jgi:predicted metal-dependent HD superfamily phosphohydrolase